MAQLIADRRDVEFVLYEQLDAEALCRHEAFRGYNRKAFDMILDEARRLAVKEILPTLAEGDRTGLSFDGGRVRVPDGFHRAYQRFVEGGWTALSGNPAFGGQGLPFLISQAAADYLLGANYALTLFGWGGYGAGEMIELFGTPSQKDLFLKKMYSGQWAGTMVLTEPEAGSDVGALITSARRMEDGTYSITGNKIFITGGEHDLTENIIHPVLARIEGAPGGTRGISLFIVPKIRVAADGTLGATNDVVCTGIEEKMGIHASPTCSLAFGSKGECRGLLLGEENKGMKVMFHMMNAARLLVGAIGSTSASTAYLHALAYARERRQGRDLEKTFDPEAPQVAIIRHPDVRRMLLWMKAYVEGMRSFIYYGAHLIDRINGAADDAERAYHQGLLDLLTPVLKAYCSDKGFEVCSQAVQVYGGYGYTREYPVEQLLRDVRIAAIYEGTNGIQAMDLLGRKIGMQNGQVFMNFMEEIGRVVKRARASTILAGLADKVETAVNRLGETAMHLGRTAMSEKFRTAFAHATPFQEAMGDVVMAWMLLWRAAAAAPQLGKLLAGLESDARRQKIESHKGAAFYDGQIRSAAFFIHTQLPTTLGKMDAILAGESAAVDMPEAGFGG